MKLETGLQVKVYNQHIKNPLDGEAFLEGIATLVEFVRKDPKDPYHQRWRVRFDSTQDLYERWVHRKDIDTFTKVLTKYDIHQLRKMDVIRLRNLIKKSKKGRTILGLSKMRREELLLILDPRDPIHAFKEDGGRIQKLKPQRIPKRKPPTDHSAECNYHLKKSKFKVPKGMKKQKIGKGDKVGIQQLADEAGITAFKTRRILRDFEIEKPDNQWYWEKNSSALEKIRKLLKGE